MSDCISYASNSSIYSTSATLQSCTGYLIFNYFVTAIYLRGNNLCVNGQCLIMKQLTVSLNATLDVLVSGVNVLSNRTYVVTLIAYPWLCHIFNWRLCTTFAYMYMIYTAKKGKLNFVHSKRYVELMTSLTYMFVNVSTTEKDKNMSRWGCIFKLSNLY